MLPYFIINQISLGPVKLYTWGLFVGLGFSAGYLLFYYLARKENLAPKKIAGLAFAIFFGAISGARGLAWLAAGGGAAFMGGLIGAILFGWGYIKYSDGRFRISRVTQSGTSERFSDANFWTIADLFVLPTALGIGIGRIGCILINDHQGAITKLPWAILWPDGIARHPVGIYESLVGFGLLAVFWFFFFSSPFQLRGRLRGGGVHIKNQHLTPTLSSSEEREENGIIFLFFLISYSAIRFFLDFTRASSGPLVDPRWGMLSVSQWLALAIVCAGAVAVFVKNQPSINK